MQHHMGLLVVRGYLHCGQSGSTIMEGVQEGKTIHSISDHGLVGVARQCDYFGDKLAVSEGIDTAQFLVLFRHS